MILLIDNYDSFTWNLYQYFCELGADVLVKRNDALTLADIDALKPLNLQSKCNKKRSTHQLEYNFVSTQK
ncbi:glutamine amidotransferase-related protein, partial [Escherichia coli]|uniref:glutamine amidotransferase-related protein n=1 Tax=Escherichia coli TaxID=562 RepID=UPI002395B74D|nr:hypothetical protein [Escherichia coli]